jgi:Amt family ammonium transporter
MAQAQPATPEPKLDSGDTAWMLTSTVLVLFMTIPGLALFYGGLVRSKNVLSVLMQCVGITAVTTVLWAVVAYSIAFSAEGMTANVKNLYSFVGSFGYVLLLHAKASTLHATIPETVWICFQLTFAIITPALICGAYAERMKFSAMMIFSSVWVVLVYAPICHMAWSGPGSLYGDWGVLDFAGGTVVHINAGVAALVSCLMLGKRKGYPSTPMPPHNLTMTVTGACMLWVGWFGFNAGSAGAANGSAGMAMLTTQLATAMAAITWAGIEWFKHGKPSALGTATGAVAGLVAITPASGSCGPLGALAIGLAAGVCCFLGATIVKQTFGYDDSLDAFGVHGVGGFTGAMLTGVFAAPALGGQGYGAPNADMLAQVLHQAMSCGVTIVYSGIVSFVILKAIDLTLGLRVVVDEEREGLDLALHGETGYIL